MFGNQGEDVLILFSGTPWGRFCSEGRKHSIVNGQSFRLPIERPRRLTVHNWIFPALWTKPTPRSTTKRNQNIFSLITKHCNYHIIIQPLVCWLTKSVLILRLFVHYVTDFWFFWQLFSRKVTRDCCAKFATGLNIIISHS